MATNHHARCLALVECLRVELARDVPHSQDDDEVGHHVLRDELGLFACLSFRAALVTSKRSCRSVQCLVRVLDSDTLTDVS